MALIVEDGTGVPTAESYAAVADADLYFSNRGNAAWAALTVPQKEQSLRSAADYMVGAYRGRWKGYRSQTAQALDWPRKAVVLTDTAINYMIPFNSVPNEIKTAQIELALRAAATATPLSPDLSQGVVHEAVGSLQTTYDRFSPQSPRYAQVDMMIRHLIVGSSSMMPLSRS